MNVAQELFGRNPSPRQWMPSASEIAVRAADRAMAIIRQRGGVPVRVQTSGKAALDPGWTKVGHVAPPADATNANVGLQTGNVIGIDCDTDDEKTAEVVLRAWAGGLPLGAMPMRYRNNSPRVLFLAKGEPGQKKVVWRIEGGGKIELLGHGQQAVAFGKHPSGAKLEWAWPSDAADSPSHALPPDLGQLPVVTAADIERCLVSAGIGFTGGLSKASPPSTAPAITSLTTTAIQNNALMTRTPSPVSEAEVQWVVDQVAMKDPSAFSDHDGAFAGGWQSLVFGNAARSTSKRPGGR